jgi:hypothetical protein
VYLDEAVRRSGRQEQPVSGSEVDPITLDVERGPPVQNDDPFVDVLAVVDGAVQPATEDLINHDMVQAGQPVDVLSRTRGGVRVAESSPGEGHRTTLPGVPRSARPPTGGVT